MAQSGQPQEYDAVKSDRASIPSTSAVLGGLEGVKQRLLLGTIEGKTDALLDAFNYGQQGLEVVIQSLEDQPRDVAIAAHLLLQASTEPKAKQALRQYNPYKRFTCLHTIDTQAEVEYLAISSNGTNLVGNCYDRTQNPTNTANVWHLGTGQLVRSFELMSNNNNNCFVAVSPDGQTLINSFQDIITVWNVDTGLKVYEFRTIVSPNSFAISPNEPVLIFGPMGLGNDPVAVKVYNLRTGVEIYALHGHTSSVESVIVSPDGQTLLSQTRRYSHKLWNLQTGKLIQQFERPFSWFADSLAINSSKQTIASGRRGDGITVWDLHTDKIIQSFPGSSPSTMSLNGKVLISVGSENTIKVWNIQTGQELCTLQGHSTGIKLLLISSDEQTLVSCEWSGIIKIWGIP